jgi:hypothetical protein
VAHRLVAASALVVILVVIAAYLAAPAQGPGALAVDSPDPGYGETPGLGVGAGTAVLPSGSSGIPASPVPTTDWQLATPPPTQPIALGAFIPGAASDPSRIDAYARLTGTMPGIVMWYQAWAGPFADFSTRAPDAISARGSMPMISWEPSAGPTNDPAWSLRTIVDGSHDAYIHRWTRAVAAWGHPIYVRPMYEMNGWWAPWCAAVNGNSATAFVTAWRHIVDIARAEGATNIRWVWSPNVDNDGLGVPFADLYPGDGYVDWVALDGFNRGTSWTSSHWVDIHRIFGGSITRLRQVTAKPLLLGETGSSEAGGDKAAWIRSLADIPIDLPDIRGIVWFDKLETEVGIDWRVNSSADALSAFRTLAASPAFRGQLP